MEDDEGLNAMDIISDEMSENKILKISGPADESAEELERKHFQRIVNAFRCYKFVSNSIKNVYHIHLYDPFWKKNKVAKTCIV